MHVLAAISNSVALLLQGGECMHMHVLAAISNSVALLLQGGEQQCCCSTTGWGVHACACPAISNSVAVLLHGGECMHAHVLQ